ncbi:hypothetical protein F2Q69_00014645 [Brassica cretica]|uniref:Uncharacterized protein n=1 Tax=Brassica cretica TaxID=69181 RepID=A0A8S9R6E5_BRACR|nr:hypothetical protein F2Q69_00014645 [Brassica cretica]
MAKMNKRYFEEMLDVEREFDVFGAVHDQERLNDADDADYWLSCCAFDMFVNLWRFFFIANLIEGPFIFFAVVISRTTVAEKQRDTPSYR